MSIQTKHFLNTSTSLVLDSLEGLCAANSQLTLDSHNKIVFLANRDPSKVAIVCGGGSGHEPAHAGFVGKGILTAAVCGNVFASPNASQVKRAIDTVDNDQGTLIIVKNYTGDVLNFGLAKENYAASNPEKAGRVKFLIVGDDVSVGKTQGSIVGRRGLAGTVLVYKIAGAAADRGSSLDEVYSIAEWVASRVGSIGVGLEHCHVPGTAIATSHLKSDEIEIGMGIHNESGTKRVSPVPPLKELIPQLLQLLTNTTDEERSFIPFQGGKGKDDVVLLVNNLGGISELELGGILAETRRALDAAGISVHRVLSGTFMTSLNMPGFSISLLLLPSSHETSPSIPSRDLILSLLDAPTDTPGWKWSSPTAPTPIPKVFLPPAAPSPSTAAKKESIILKSADPNAFIQSIERACKAVIAAEPEITRMDTIAGDGDCGTTLEAGANGVLKMIRSGAIQGNDVVASIIAISQVAEEAMGGTSGALYSIFFSALALGLQANATSGIVTPELWSSALTSALANLYTYTRARKPSRTLIDPLSAFVEACPSLDFTAAVKAASAAAEETVNVDAKAGRSAYVESNRLKEQKVPDPGAWGVREILLSLNL